MDVKFAPILLSLRPFTHTHSPSVSSFSAYCECFLRSSVDIIEAGLQLWD